MNSCWVRKSRLELGALVLGRVAISCSHQAWAWSSEQKMEPTEGS